MHAAAALAPDFAGDVVDVAAAAALAAGLPLGLPPWLEAEPVLEEAAAGLGVGGGGVDRVEALRGRLGGDLGMVGEQGRGSRLHDAQLVLEALGVREAKTAVGALGVA